MGVFRPDPITPLVGQGFRFARGDDFVFRVAGTVATRILAIISVLYDDGGESDVPLEVLSPTDGSAVSDTSSPVTRGGLVVGCRLDKEDAGIERGELYCQVRIGHRPDIEKQGICAGYMYDEHPLNMGTFDEPGPGGGNGKNTPRTWADDVAGDVDTTLFLSDVNRIRRIDGFVRYYHASGDTATRDMIIRLRDVGSGVPTGFDAGNDRQIFTIAGPQLIANQDGIVYCRNGLYSITVDNGTPSVENNTTAPNPFPFWVHEDESPIDLQADISSGHANDRYSAYLFQEEWIQP